MISSKLKTLGTWLVEVLMSTIKITVSPFMLVAYIVIVAIHLDSDPTWMEAAKIAVNAIETGIKVAFVVSCISCFIHHWNEELIVTITFEDKQKK